MPRNHPNRPYIVCACGAWLYADRASKVRWCTQCYNPWFAAGAEAPRVKPKAQAKWSDWSQQPAPTRKVRFTEPQAPPGLGKGKKVAALQEAIVSVWGTLPQQTQEAMKIVGVEPPQQKDPDLLELLRAQQESLPAEIRAVNEARAPPPKTPVQQGLEASKDFKAATGRLRELGSKKLHLQTKIDVTKSMLKTQLDEMRALILEVEACQAEVTKISAEYEAKVLAGTVEEPAEVTPPVAQQVEATSAATDVIQSLKEELRQARELIGQLQHAQAPQQVPPADPDTPMAPDGPAGETKEPQSKKAKKQNDPNRSRSPKERGEGAAGSTRAEG